MDQDPPPPRRRALSRTLPLAPAGVAAVLAGAAAIARWCFGSGEARWRDPDGSGTGEPGGSDPGIDPPEPPPAPVDPGRDPGSSGDGSAPSCEPEVSCDDPLSCDDLGSSCAGTSCDAGACDSGSVDCASGATGQLVSGALSAAAVLPLWPIARWGGRRGSTGRVTIPARVALAAIAGYRRRISPHTATRCRFTPSCSRYGSAVIRRHGLAVGARPAVARVRRCTREVPPGTPDPPP